MTCDFLINTLMKKLLLTAAVIVAAGSAWAQDRYVNRAQTWMSRDSLDKAQEELTIALTSGETKNMAKAWAVQGELYQKIFVTELDKVTAHAELDTAKFSKYLLLCLDAFENCLENDVKNEYGDKRDLMPQFRTYMLASAQFENQNSNYEGAYTAYDSWLDFPQNYKVVADHPKVVNDTTYNRSQIAYYACLVAYQGKMYDKVGEHMEEALGYEKEAKTIRQLHLTCLNEAGDTAQWEQYAKKYAMEDEAVAQNLLAYYSGKGNDEAANAFTEELLAADPNSKIANYAKGVTLYGEEKYDEALPYFEKSAEADPEFSDAFYNAGVCCTNYGYALNEEISNKQLKGEENKKKIEEVKDWYRKAEPFFLKVKELEPESTDKWASRLKTIYYIIGDEAKAAEMDTYIKEE